MSGFPWNTLITAGAPVVASLGTFWLTVRYADRTQARQAAETRQTAQADRRRQAYGELVMTARLALRNFRQLSRAYAVGTPDIPAVNNAMSQTDSLTASVYQAAALTEIIASPDSRLRARSIHDKTRDCADLFQGQELITAAWPRTSAGKAFSFLPAEVTRNAIPFDTGKAKDRCDELAAAIDQFIETVNLELGQ